MYDEHRNVSVDYRRGNIVYVRVNPTAAGQSVKVELRYRGPYVIIWQISGEIYEIELIAKISKKIHWRTICPS